MKMAIGDLARGGHQAHWVELFEVTPPHNPWYLRLAWAVKDVFRPRVPLEGYGRVFPGQSIRMVGTGYEEPTLPGGPTHSARRGGREAYRYHD